MPSYTLNRKPKTKNQINFNRCILTNEICLQNTITSTVCEYAGTTHNNERMRVLRATATKIAFEVCGPFIIDVRF